MSAETLRQSLNRADPNTLADMLRSAGLGDALRSLPVALRGVNVNAQPASASQPAALSLQCIALPEDAKAASILRATALAGTGSKGELTISAFSVTPVATHAAVAPNGDLVFLANDAYTSVNVDYVPERGDVVAGLVLPVNTSTYLASLPSPYAGAAVLLMACTASVGTSGGAKSILAPQATVTAGNVALNVAHTGVVTNSTDALTSVTVDVLVNSGVGGGVDINAALESSSSDV